METNLSIIPQTGMAVMRRNILDQEIEDAVIVEPNVMVEEDHPHFIESNTNEITLEELKNKCVVPVFGDNSLTISHQNFIEKVYQAANDCFLGEQLGKIECRVSHPVIGRIPTALHKKQANSEKMKRLCFIKEWHFALRLNP